MKKFFRLAQISLFVFALSLFSACEKDNTGKELDFTKTSWESKIDVDGILRSITISFMTADSGIMREEAIVDGNEAILYSVFTYKVNEGNGTLHISDQYTFQNNKMVGKVLSGSDVHFVSGIHSDKLECNYGESTQNFARTEFQPIYLPAASNPDDEQSDIVLKYDMLLGSWGSAFTFWQDCSFAFSYIPELAQHHYSNVHVSKFDIFGGWYNVAHDTMLYPEIGTPANTVVIYDNWSNRNVMFYLVFLEYDAETKGYVVSFQDASHNELICDTIVKK